MNNRANRRAAVSQMRKRGSWQWEERDPHARGLANFDALQRMRTCFVNDFYIVQVYDFASEIGPMVHLAIRSVTGAGTASGVEPPWRDLQRIKNELVSPVREAVQVHPKQADVTDVAPIYHLFVLPETWALPFGLHRECGFVPKGAR